MNMNRKLKKVLSCLLMAGLFLVSIVFPAFAGISPSLLTATLSPGESITESIDAPTLPLKVDIVFAFDLTWTMSGIVDTAKTKSAEIMAGLDNTGFDINYGVMSHMDYPGTYSSYNYNLRTYGIEGDYAYRLDQSVTSDKAAVTTAINGLVMGNGGDNPENYTRVMYESYADPNMNWREGAKKILINFGDNVPHDNNLNEGIGSTIWSSGGDPGRDGIILNDDDLDLQTVLQGMADNNVTLLECNTSIFASEYWSYWTGLTGGAFYITGPATMAADIITAVNNALTIPDINGLTLKASSGFEGWLTTVAPASYSGPRGTNVNFNAEITVPEGTAAGTYNFIINAVDSSDVNYGSQNVEITVTAASTKIMIDIVPGDFSNLINFESKGKVPVAVLGSATFDVSTINRNTVIFAGTPALEIGGGLGDVNGDGYMDIVFHFATQELVLDVNNTEAVLSCQTTDGKYLSASDSVTVNKCNVLNNSFTKNTKPVK